MSAQELRKPDNLSWDEAICKNLDAQQMAIARAPSWAKVGLMDNLTLLKGLFRSRGFGPVVDEWEKRR